jgi:hypothetical protein
MKIYMLAKRTSLLVLFGINFVSLWELLAKLDLVMPLLRLAKIASSELQHFPLFIVKSLGTRQSNANYTRKYVNIHGT